MANSCDTVPSNEPEKYGKIGRDRWKKITSRIICLTFPADFHIIIIVKKTKLLAV
jgi:hypothetical protein